MESININSGSCREQLQSAIKSIADGVNVFMCIGTEKVVSDSLGPRVGKLLTDKMNKPLFVYGTENANITAENLMYSYNFIKALHPDSKIAVVDAGVGKRDQVGEIQVIDGGIIPGAATNKNLPEVGDVSIVGIVAERGLADFYHSTTSKITLVERLANIICDAVTA
jgi:putative sporulation protein YyaC